MYSLWIPDWACLVVLVAVGSVGWWLMDLDWDEYRKKNAGK